jgi:uncharacterized membrane protein HdeD (DUF308 family)
MAKSRSVELYKIGIIIALGGVVFLLFTFFDYLQDGKTEGGIIAVGVLLIAIGALLYMNGKKPKAQEE